MWNRLVLCVVWTLSFATAGFAQGVQTGTIRGAVTSSDGRALPGATVTIRSTALQGTHNLTTEEDGRYVFGLVPAGDYDVSFELSGMAMIERHVEVPLGGVALLNVTMAVAAVAETVTVTAPASHGTPVAGLNIKHDEVEALAMSRTLSSIAELSPGLTNITPNSGQLSISGAFAFDNVFMLNGVDINDNLFGAPQNLFIEDAIQEVQTLTSGIGAEYGRFSGGVVNAITRSGGNIFSGSFRTNFTNPKWSTETPFEVASQSTHPDILNKSYEGTLGGPIVKDRLWFFAAGRSETVAIAQTFAQTGYANTETDKNKRGEIKLTATLAAGHTLQGGYLNNQTDNENRPSVPFSIDRFTITPASQPNWFTFAKYQGTLGNRVLAEVQYSQRAWSRVGGGTATSIVDSPFFDSTFSSQYNAPYFDASDPEHRNNKQVTASLTSFLEGHGRHELKTGYEWYRSQWAGGNAQTPTGYYFITDFATNAAGLPVYDASGHLLPIFEPGATVIDRSIIDPASVLNVDTQSVYVQDHWTAAQHWSFDLGARFEHVNTGTTSGIAGVRANRLVPRLAATYDVKGDGRWVARATYAHYSGRYDENQIGKNTLQGNSNDIVGVYVGPAGQGRSFTPGFDPANYLTVQGSFPTANVSFAKDLSSPVTREFTASLGSDAEGRGSVEARYVFRRTSNLMDDFISLANGVTDIVQNGVDAGTFTNIVWQNTDIATREYQAMLFQANYRLRQRWSVNGHYTVMLKNEGNDEGESPNSPAEASIIGNYPEAFNAARNYPTGRLQSFQRHKLRVWTVYDLGLGPAGRLGLSGLWRVNSAQVYSLKATVPLTPTQLALISAYPDSPASQRLFFGGRGSQDFAGYGVFDTSINYDVPVFRSLRPWVKFDVFNLFDNLKLISWNTTIRPDPASPKDSLGLATGYIPGGAFGTATSNTNFPAAVTGASGGRTFRVAVGFRF